MYALKVSINGGEPIVAGADDLGTLNAIISCSGKLGLATNLSRRDDSCDFTISVGGLTSRSENMADEHLHWLSQAPLQIGHTVLVEIVETTCVAPVIGGMKAEKRKNDEREYFEHCKRAYFDMRSRYEVAPD